LTGEDTKDQPAVSPSRGERKKRTRIYGKHYAKLKAQLWYYQGEACFYRLAGCTNTRDAIAHKDHNPQNWDPANLAVSCHHCNGTISNQGAGGVLVSAREKRPEREISPNANLVSLSDKMHAELEAWLWKRLGPMGPHKYLPLRTIYREAGHDCQISASTLYKYLDNPGDMVASNARWRHVDRALDPRLPEKKTTCLMWVGHVNLDEDLEEQLYRTGRKEFVRDLSETAIN
jgi:hypothetical protein